MKNSLLKMSPSFEQPLPHIEEEEFLQWLNLLELRIGVKKSLVRKSFLVPLLESQSKKIGMVNYKQYYDYLSSAEFTDKVWSEFIDKFTTRETWFFRKKPSLALVKELFSAWTIKGQKKNQNNKFGVWSLGCASGEEPYSLAITLLEHVKQTHSTVDSHSFDFQITASDISQDSLRIAERGIYTQRQVKNINDIYLQNYFNPVDNDRYQITKTIRDHVKFTTINIVDYQASNHLKVDVIFCQNLLIYFARNQRIKILNRLVEQLLPNGMLILGAGEIINWSHPHMMRIANNTILAFRKVHGSTQ